MIECHLYVPQHITGVNVRLSYKVYAAVIFAFHILSTVSGFYVLWIDNPQHNYIWNVQRHRNWYLATILDFPET